MAVTWQDNSKIDLDTWLLNRNKSIGASEVGAVVFGSKYTSSLEIFYNKVCGASKKIENIRMFLGKETEEISARMWEHYNDTDQSVVDNIRKGTPVKKCINLNSTAYNSDFPQLSATPDRTIIPFGIYENRKTNGALEIKNTTSQVLKSYESLLPTENVIQLVTQMMCCEYSFGELFYFIDNRNLKSHPIDISSTKKVQQVILLHTSKLWKNILLARPLYNQLIQAKRNTNFRLVAELENEIAKLEPEMQNSNGFMSFLTERYKERISLTGIVKGTDAQLLIAKKHKEFLKKAKKIEEQQRELEIQLKMFLKDNVCLDFGKAGKINYYPTVKGNRLFKNQIL